MRIFKTLFIGGLLVLVVDSSACRSKQAGTDARHDESPTSSEQSCGFDLTEEHADAVFFVLGLRASATIRPGDDLIDSFFCNEKSAATLFERQTAILADQQRISRDLQLVIESDCVRFYRSKLLADRLNSCYVSSHGNRGSIAASAIPGAAVLNPSLFYGSAASSLMADKSPSPGVLYRRRALAFLAGVWARHGRGDDLVFVGPSAVRAEFVAWLLSDLGCLEVSVERSVGIIPGAASVHFLPTSEVESWLHRKR